MSHSIKIAVFALLAGMLAGGCTYDGSPTTPVERNLTWFSYLNGDDIREACTPGAPDRYRFVYNAIYTEQVRAYDIEATGAEGDLRLESRVFAPADLKRIALSEPLDIFAPWQPRRETADLTDGDLASLRAALRADGAFTPLPETLQLSSDDFYWIVSACTTGTFHFNAYRWPSPRFEALTFPDILFGWDGTGVAVNPPREADPYEIHGASSGEEMRSAHRFNLAAGADGLKGLLRLF